jgi:murein DD-endopeptidase MepM/ murein hydrolase activator NlpD
MITKKLKNKIFVWNPNAFNGRGYWFVLGKNGSYGLAASKKEAGYLSRPTVTQTKQNSPEPEDTESGISEKGISENTQQFLNGLKNKFSLKNLKNMIKPTGEKMTEGITGEKDQSEMFGKTKPSSITPEKIGNVDTAFFTKVASSRIEAPKRGDSIATVSTRILALFDKTYQERKLERELIRNFEHEKMAEDKRRHEELIKKIYESKGMKTPKGKNENVTKFEDKLDKQKLDDIKNIKIEEGNGGGTTGGPSTPTGTTPNKPTAPVNTGPSNASTTATKSSSTSISPPNIPQGKLPTGVTSKNNFEEKRSYYKSGETHAGNDYPAPMGTPLYAVKDGKITHASWENPKDQKQGYGQYIDVNHGDGTSTRYGHLSQMDVKVGTKVKSGQQIALSGNTGHSTGPHLHFEYRENGKPVKPYDYGILAFNPGKKLEEVPKTNTETATKMSPDAEIALFRGITKKAGYENSSVGVDATAKSLMESGFKAEAKDYDKFVPPKAKDGMPLYGFSAGAAPAIEFARKNPNVKFSTAYLIDPHSSSLGPLLDNVPKNINKIIVWYNPNQPYLKPYLNRMVSHDNIEFRKNYTPHMLMPQNLKSEIVADIKNKATQIASNDKGTDLNNKSLENKNLKNEVNPVIAVNNSESTTKIGNKSEPKILVAKNKPDLPIFMQESIQFR